MLDVDPEPARVVAPAAVLHRRRVMWQHWVAASLISTESIIISGNIINCY